METKIILLTLTYLVGAGELILAIYFWVTHSKSEIRKVMALLAFSTGMWVITSAFTCYKSQTDFLMFVSDLVFFFGMLLIALLLYFCLIYPFKLFNIDIIHKLLFFLPVLIFTIIIFTTKTIVAGMIGSENESGAVISGPLHSVYNLYLIILYVSVLYVLFYRIRKLDGVIKRNYKIILGSIVIGGLPAVFISLVVPTFFPQIQETANPIYGNLSTLIWLGTTTYIIKRK